VFGTLLALYKFHKCKTNLSLQKSYIFSLKYIQFPFYNTPPPPPPPYVFPTAWVGGGGGDLAGWLPGKPFGGCPPPPPHTGSFIFKNRTECAAEHLYLDNPKYIFKQQWIPRTRQNYKMSLQHQIVVCTNRRIKDILP
jgi:hypothetical protein